MVVVYRRRLINALVGSHGVRNTKLWKCNALHQIPVYIKQNEDKTSHEIVNLTRIKSLKSSSANIGELDHAARLFEELVILLV